MMSTNKNNIIIFSGGIDSTYLLTNLLQNEENKQCLNVVCVYFNYGQKCYVGEYHSAQKICNLLNIPLYEINISDTYKYNNDSAILKQNDCLTTSIVNTVYMNDTDTAINVEMNKDTTELLFRNNLFVLNAAILGRQLFKSEPFNIFMGIISGGDFDDCSELFVNNMNNLLNHQCKNSKLVCPIINLKKEQVLQRLMSNALYKNLLSMTWSCYESITREECGHCYNCVCKEQWRIQNDIYK